MFESEQKMTTTIPTLAENLFQIYHEFTMFTDYYAAFCDTLAKVLVENERLDAGTVQGITRCSNWMKHRMKEYSEALAAIQKRQGSGQMSG